MVRDGHLLVAARRFLAVRAGFWEYMAACGICGVARNDGGWNTCMAERTRRLTPADYIIVLSCASVPVLCMFTVYEWARVSFFHF